MTTIRTSFAAACIAMLLTLGSMGALIIAPAEQMPQAPGVLAAATLLA